MIYCVEDDDGIRELIVCALRSGGYTAEGFCCADDFYKKMETAVPELILLDIMLPDEDGYSILRKLKANAASADIPVIMLTAKSEESDKVTGLESGADDYITKPFGIMELLSRIRAVLRRAGKHAHSSELLSYKNIVMDLQRRTVLYGDTPVSLTFKEFELLAYLLRNREIVITRENILEKIWGYNFVGETRTVDMHIKSLNRLAVRI